MNPDLHKPEDEQTPEEKSASEINRSEETISPPAGDTAPKAPLGDNEAAADVDPEATLITTKAGSALPKLTEIGGYQIEGILGRGGMGIVYLAHDRKLNRKVALKTLSIDFVAKGSLGQRLELEARALAKIRHPHVAQVYEAGTDQGRPFLTMELISGPTLSDHCRTNSLDAKEACRIGIAISEAVHECHQCDVIHRDLKPSNVILANGEFPKVTDFGLAKLREQESQLTHTGEVMGTPSYMAPEQASGVVKNVGPKTDVYGLGAILYEMLTGRPPFMSPKPVQTVMLVLTQEPVAPSSIQPGIPKDLETICLKCLAKKPADRYESALALAEDLRRFQRGEPILARRPGTLERLGKWVRRRPAVAALVGLIFLGVIGVITGLSLHNNALQNELDRSQRIIAQSRKLSEWLLFDFSLQLTTDVGPTANREDLTDHIQEYLNALVTEAEMDIELKTDVARSLLQLARLQGDPDEMNLGRVAAAEKTLKQVETMLDALAKTDSSADRIRRLRGMMLLTQARIEQDKNDVATAEKLVAEAEPLILAVDRHKDGQTYAATLRLREIQYGLAFVRGEYEPAKASLERLEKLANEESSHLSESERTQFQARVSLYRADMLERQQKQAEAIPDLEATLAKVLPVYEKFPDDSFRGTIAQLANKLGDATYHAQNFEVALAHYQTAVEARKGLLKSDPSNALHAYNVAVSLVSLGDTYAVLEQHQNALDVFNEAEKHYKLVSGDAVGKLGIQPALGFLAGSRGTLYFGMGEYDKAEKQAREKIRLLTPSAKENATHQRAIGEAQITLGSIYASKVIAAIEDENSPFPEKTYQQMEQSLKGAIAIFDQMEKEGMMSEVEKFQRGQAQNMLKVMQEFRESLPQGKQ